MSIKITTITRTADMIVLGAGMAVLALQAARRCDKRALPMTSAFHSLSIAAGRVAAGLALLGLLLSRP